MHTAAVMPATSFLAFALVKAWSAVACWRQSVFVILPWPAAAAALPSKPKTGSWIWSGLLRFRDAPTVVRNCSWECSATALASIVRTTQDAYPAAPRGGSAAQWPSRPGGRGRRS
jgi:hypothetical protein